jgi:hypothetical protein
MIAALYLVSLFSPDLWLQLRRGISPQFRLGFNLVANSGLNFAPSYMGRGASWHSETSKKMEYAVKAETKEGDIVTLRRGFPSRSDAEDFPVRLSLWRRVWVERQLSEPASPL